MEDEIYNFKEHHKKGDIIHYLRVVPNSGINDIVECRLRTVESDYMVGVGCDTSKQTILMDRSAINLIFKDRKLAAKESKKYTVRKVTREIQLEDD